MEASVDVIRDTTDGLIDTRTSVDLFNYMRETTDCINGMGAKADGGISTGNFPGAMKNIKRELPSGMTWEAKLGTWSNYCPNEINSHGDDLSDSVSYDCLGVIEDKSDRYERLRMEGVTGDGHIYTAHIRVMRDILAQMPPGMTAEDVLGLYGKCHSVHNGIWNRKLGTKMIRDATEEQNERLQLDGNRYDGHVHMGHIPPVMTDIPSPGVTREDNND